MKFSGIDLHSNNNVVVVSDEEDRIVYQKRLPNNLEQTRAALEPYRAELAGVVVESTYKRMQLVRCLTTQILAIENILARQTGGRISSNQVKQLTAEQIEGLGFVPGVALALGANRAVSETLQQQIEVLERRLKERVKLRPEYRLLKTVPRHR
jgi:hypothetical protein